MAGGAGGGMGRLMGFGFLFGARDDGATRTASEVREEVEGIGTAAKRLGADAANGFRKLNAVIGALQLQKLNEVGDSLRDIADRAGAMSDVATSSVESWGAQAGLAFRQATAGAGEFRGELEAMRGQIVGTARALDMDVQSLTRLNRGILTAGTSLDELGLSQREVAGALQSGIIDAEGFGQSLREMRQGLGMSGEEIGNLLDEFTALGESVGEGEAFVRGIPQMLEGIREGVSEFPALRRNSRQLVSSLGRLARGMQQVSGSTPEEALGATNQVFQTLLGSRRSLRDLFSGMGTDFDEFATQLGIGGAGIGGALEMVLSDPATFAVKAAELFERSGGAGSVMGDRLTSVLSRMGPQFVRLIDGSEESRAALAAMGAELGDVSGRFGQMARASSGSTLTFADQMDRLRDNFGNSINTMMNRMARARGEMSFDAKVLRQQRDAYRSLTRRVQGYAERQDALGASTRMLLGFRRGGLVGLSVVLQDELGRAFPNLKNKIKETLPMMGEFGSMAFEGAQQLAPMLVAMRALNVRIPGLGLAMKLLFNPITLIAGGIYLLVRYWDRLEPILRVGSRLFREWSEEALQSVKEVDWANMGRNIVDGIIMAFGAVGDMEGTNETTRAIAEGLRNVFSAASIAIRGLASGIWDKIVEYVTEPEGVEGKVRRGAGVFGVVLAAAMFTPMRGPLLSGASRMFLWLGGRMIGMMGPSGILGSTVMRGGAAAGRGLGSLLGRIIGIPTSRGIASGVQAAISGQATTAAAARGAGGLFGRIGGALSGVLGRGAGRAVAGTAMRSAVRAIPGVGAILGVLFDLPQILESFRTEGITGGFTQVVESIINGMLLGIPRMLSSLTGFNIIERFLDYMGFNRMMDAFRSGDWTQMLTEGLWNLFSGVLGNIPNIIRTAISDITGVDVVGDLLGNIGIAMRGGWEFLTDLGGILFDTFGELVSIFRDVLSPLWEAMSLAFNELRAVGTEVWSEIQSVASDLFVELRDAFSEVIATVQDVVFPLLTDLGELFMGLWNDYAQPAISAIWSFYRRVFMQYILPAGRRVFQELGRYVSWWWNNVTKPVLEFLGRTWLRVMTFMKDIGFQVIGAIARFMVNKFFDAMAAIASMRANWQGFVNTVQATSNAVRVILTNSLETPLLAAEHSLMTIADRIQETFSGLRLVVVDLVRTLVTQLRDAVLGLGAVGELLVGPFNESVTAMDNAFTRQQAAVAEEARLNRQASQARRDELADRVRQNEEAVQGVRDAYSNWQTGVAEAQQGVRDEQDDFMEGMAGVGERISDTLETSANRISELFTEEGRAQSRARRTAEERERRQQQLRDARQLVEHLGGARGLTPRERQAIAGAVVAAAEQGRAIDAQAVMQQVSAVTGRGAARQEAISGVMQSLGVEMPEEPAGGGGNEPGRRRGRAQAAHQRRQVAQEQRAQAEVQELANELVISSFGPEAVRQLGQALTIQVMGAGLPPPVPESGQVG